MQSMVENASDLHHLWRLNLDLNQAQRLEAMNDQGTG
jgi:hypothetical protein